MAQGSQVSEPCKAVFGGKSSKHYFILIPRLLKYHAYASGSRAKTFLHLTQEESRTGRALRVAAEPLAHMIQRAGAQDVCKAPVMIPPEVNQMYWPSYISQNNILPILA